MTIMELSRPNSASLFDYDFQPCNQSSSAFIEERWLVGFARQIEAIADADNFRVAANRALTFLQRHAPEMLIAPAVTFGEDHSIQIEWHNDLVDLEIEFFADQDAEAYVWFHDEANSSMGPLREDLGPGGRVYLAFQKTMDAAAA